MIFDAFIKKKKKKSTVFLDNTISNTMLLVALYFKVCHCALTCTHSVLLVNIR